MECEPSNFERRKTNRFTPIPGCLAVLCRPPIVLGEITNIGRKGLCYQYVAIMKNPDSKGQLKILPSHGGLCFSDVPFKRLWDRPINLTGLSEGALEVRHAGVRFERLTGVQKKELEHFLQYYAEPPFQSC